MVEDAVTLRGSYLSKMVGLRLLFGVIGGLVAVVGTLLWIRGRRHLALVVSRRKLGADARSCSTFDRSAMIAWAAAPLDDKLPFARGRTAEEKLLRAFGGIWSGVAIGRPGTISRNSAHRRRLYIEDDAGKSWSGSAWRAPGWSSSASRRPMVSRELGQALGVVDPVRLVLLLPFDRAGDEPYRLAWASRLPRLERDGRRTRPRLRQAWGARVSGASRRLRADFGTRISRPILAQGQGPIALADVLGVTLGVPGRRQLAVVDGDDRLPATVIAPLVARRRTNVRRMLEGRRMGTSRRHQGLPHLPGLVP